MELKIIDKLPSVNGIIGARDVQKGIKSGETTHVIFAKNCPEWLANKITKSESAGNLKLEQFNGNERELGTALGKPFAIAMVGFKE